MVVRAIHQNETVFLVAFLLPAHISFALLEEQFFQKNLVFPVDVLYIFSLIR